MTASPPPDGCTDLWPRLAGLPLRIEGYALERLEQDVSSAFTRVSTHVRLSGGGEEGIGEDVSYEPAEHDALHAAGPILPLAGDWTLASFCDHLATLDLWPEPPVWGPSPLYRAWAYESAALDLALRQAGRPLHEALGLTPAPVRFLVSLSLGETPTLAPMRARLARHPGLRFKLDATVAWGPDLIEAVAATGAVESIDFKGHYGNQVPDVAALLALYRRVLEALPEAWIEDPHDLPEVHALLAAHLGRVSYDAPVHSVADIDALPLRPRLVNVKPSRAGGLRPLLGIYARCRRDGIGMYGGGQFELGVGRGQIQLLAALFHADAPNDVAPGGYNLPTPPAGLPHSPLDPAPEPTGFRRRP